MSKRLIMPKSLRVLGRGTAKQTQAEAQEKYFLRLITSNPEYELILASLKQGISCAEVAKHFAMNNWITVNERSFAEALRTFKRVKADVIKAYTIEGVAEIIDPNSPELDEAAVLDQMIRLQMLRIGIDVKHERTMGKLFNTTVKEVEIVGKLVEAKAKIKGKINQNGQHVPDALPVDVNERLTTVKKDQSTRDRLAMLVKQAKEGTLTKPTVTQ